MLHPLISALILETKRIIEVKGPNLCYVHPAFVINLARLFEGKELPLFQHCRSTKTSCSLTFFSYKVLNVWVNIISVQGHYLVKICLLHTCMERLHL